MSRSLFLSELPESDFKLLEVVNRLTFVCHDHLVYWLGKNNVASVQRPAVKLFKAGLLDRHSEFKNSIYRLSHRSSRLLNQPYKKKWFSAPAIHQYLMSGRCEIFMRQNVAPHFQLFNAKKLKARFGLNVAVGEWLAFEDGSSIEKKANTSNWVLMLIDDYLMPSDRIKRCYERVHKNKFNPEFESRMLEADTASWKNYVGKVLVFTTSRERLVSHQEFIDSECDFNVEVRYIEPYWVV